MHHIHFVGGLEQLFSCFVWHRYCYGVICEKENAFQYVFVSFEAWMKGAN